MNRPGIVVIAMLALTGAAVRAQHSQMPAGMTHEEHLKQLARDAELKKRGAEVMGFDQDKTVHHFLLAPTGGSIVVSARDLGDTTSIDQVRTHLRDIAAAFARGDFDQPLRTHAEVPPGTAEMGRLAGQITFRYEESPDGGLVRIETRSEAALRAIHAFLRYQIEEHRTGDALRPPR